jgi:hypothetical protein
MSNATKGGEKGPAESGLHHGMAGQDEEGHVPAAEGLQSLMADRQRRIQVAAYYLAEHRGFAPGHELDDWLAAEDAIEAEDAARWSED